MPDSTKDSSKDEAAQKIALTILELLGKGVSAEEIIRRFREQGGSSEQFTEFVFGLETAFKAELRRLLVRKGVLQIIIGGLFCAAGVIGAGASNLFMMWLGFAAGALFAAVGARGVLRGLSTK